MFRKKTTASYVKPSGSFRLNERHPLARSLALCIPFNGFSESVGSGREIWTRDLGIIKSTSEQATPKHNSDRFGLWGSFEKSVPDGFLIENLPSTFPGISATQHYTALAWQAKSGQVAGDTYNIIKRDDNVTNNDSILFISDSGLAGATLGGINIAAVDSVVNDEPALLGSLWDGSTGRMIVRGKYSGSAAVSALNSGITVLRIGFRIDLSPIRAYKGPLHVIYLFDRALSETETLLINDAPFALFSTSVSFPVFKKVAAASTSVFSSIGSAIVSGVGLSEFLSIASSSGAATVSGISSVVGVSIFSSSGSSTVTGVSGTAVPVIATGSSSGFATVNGVNGTQSANKHVGGVASNSRKTITLYPKTYPKREKNNIDFIDQSINQVKEKETEKKHSPRKQMNIDLLVALYSRMKKK